MASLPLRVGAWVEPVLRTSATEAARVALSPVRCGMHPAGLPCANWASIAALANGIFWMLAVFASFAGQRREAPLELRAEYWSVEPAWPRSSDRTFTGSEFACASIAVPAC